MGLIDRLLGRSEAARPGPTSPPAASGPAANRDPDAVAVERYRYLLRTAPPETIEQAHAEAFARLTPEQRRQVLAEVAQGLPERERATSDDPRSLARMATRAELSRPGYLESRLGGGFGGGLGGGGFGRSGGIGLGGVIGGSLLGSVAGAFIGTAIADELFDHDDSDRDVDDNSDRDFADNGNDFDAGNDTGAADSFADDTGTGFDDSGFDAGDAGDFGSDDF